MGNIGIPPFDRIEQIKDETRIVFELSSHQLQDISVSPHTACLLNLYQEHLDHYSSYSSYQMTKFNIARYQKSNDFLIINADDGSIVELLSKINIVSTVFKFSAKRIIEDGAYLNSSGRVVYHSGNSISEFDFTKRRYLPGQHNLMNIMAAVCISKIHGVPDQIIENAVNEFKGLPHRLEFVGEFSGISFYNDSIATIPEATIEAVNTLKNVDTLVVGGKDRGVDYQGLVKFLSHSDIRTIIFIGVAGNRILNEFISFNPNHGKNVFPVKQFDEIRYYIKKYTRPGTICLLSPAAASYDMFNNFEERGDQFKKIAETI